MNMHYLNTAEISKVGALLADSARTAIIVALCEDTALPAGELAERAGISASTTSIHLARLMDAGWIAVEQHGRQRYYKLAAFQVKRLLKLAMSAAPRNTRQIAPLQQLQAAPEYTPHATHHARDNLRIARICYDHLAGKLGVTLTDALLQQGVLEIAEKDFKLTSTGSVLLENLGVDVAAASRQRRAFARRCLDWTERRYHLGGALGAAICAQWFDQGWVQRQDSSRALLITASGEAHLPAWGITTIHQGIFAKGDTIKE
jgi:DNA-binding transcriptional ArsR family regulator